MKLGFQILILMVFCFSCKDEKVFDSSPSERNANHIGELRKELVVSSTLAVSNIRNRTYTNYEVYLIGYGYGKFKEKIHFME